MPLFERYYHQSVKYEISKIGEPLDDLFGTLASCQFRVIAMGKVTRIENEFKIPFITFGNVIKSSLYSVEINKIGVYVKDSFDFITEDEYLGDWSPSKNTVKINILPIALPDHYKISNASYREWRLCCMIPI